MGVLTFFLLTFFNDFFNLKLTNKKSNIHTRFIRHLFYPGFMAVFLFANPIGLLASETITEEMVTSAGDIQIDLYPQAAPVTVENFLAYVDGAFYSNARFYRVVRMDNQQQN